MVVGLDLAAFVLAGHGGRAVAGQGWGQRFRSCHLQRQQSATKINTTTTAAATTITTAAAAVSVLIVQSDPLP